MRVYACDVVVEKEWLGNDTLMSLGLIISPLQILQTDCGSYILGLLYTYLPFHDVCRYIYHVRKNGYKPN